MMGRNVKDCLNNLLIDNKTVQDLKRDLEQKDLQYAQSILKICNQQISKGNKVKLLQNRHISVKNNNQANSSIIETNSNFHDDNKDQYEQFYNYEETKENSLTKKLFDKLYRLKRAYKQIHSFDFTGEEFYKKAPIPEYLRERILKKLKPRLTLSLRRRNIKNTIKGKKVLHKLVHNDIKKDNVLNILENPNHYHSRSTYKKNTSFIKHIM